MTRSTVTPRRAYQATAALRKGLRLVRETIVSLRRKFRDVDRGFTAIAVSRGLGYLWAKDRAVRMPNSVP